MIQNRNAYHQTEKCIVTDKLVPINNCLSKIDDRLCQVEQCISTLPSEIMTECLVADDITVNNCLYSGDIYSSGTHCACNFVGNCGTITDITADNVTVNCCICAEDAHFTKACIDNFTFEDTTIEHLNADKADIDSLDASYACVNTLDTETSATNCATIETACINCLQSPASCIDNLTTSCIKPEDGNVTVDGTVTADCFIGIAECASKSKDTECFANKDETCWCNIIKTTCVDNADNTTCFANKDEACWCNIIKTTCVDNADKAHCLACNVCINGTPFNGTETITTECWGTTRNISISDSTKANVSCSCAMSGSADLNLVLPSTIKACIKGNADTSTNSTCFNGCTYACAKADILAGKSCTSCLSDCTKTICIAGNAGNIPVIQSSGTYNCVGRSSATINANGKATFCSLCSPTVQSTTVCATNVNATNSNICTATIQNACVNCDLSIGGNLDVGGTITCIDAQHVLTEDENITLRNNATSALPSGHYSGFCVCKYDGTNDFEVGVDSTGTLRIGTCSSDMEAVATRAEAACMENCYVSHWNNSNLELETKGTSCVHNLCSDACISATCFCGKLKGNADTATNSTCFGGCTYAQAKADILAGTAAKATTLATARTINGTSFDGSSNITTSCWGTSRTITIKDCDNTNAATGTSVNGSSNVVLNLPGTIKATICGNVCGNAACAATVCRCQVSSGTCHVLLAPNCTATASGAVNVSCACTLTYQPGTGTLTAKNFSGTATNATCFGGCTYDCAKADIRNYTPSLACCSCCARLGEYTANCDRPIVITCGLNTFESVGKAACCTLTFNPATGQLKAKCFTGNSSTATNSTCFGGCTYACACANIRSGLTGCTGTVTVSDTNANCNWPVALKTGSTAIGCSTSCSITYNPTTGVLATTTFCGNLSGTASSATNATCLGGRTSNQYVKSCLAANIGPNAGIGHYMNMTTNSGITGCWTHIINLAWQASATDVWQSQIAVPTYANSCCHMAFRTHCSTATSGCWQNWNFLIDDRGGQTIKGNLSLCNVTTAPHLIIQGITCGCDAITTNPGIVFKNSGANQNVCLLFSDYDNYFTSGSAGLTLLGDQICTWLKAPYICATSGFYGSLNGTATNATCLNGYAYDCLFLDFRRGLTGCTGTVTSVNISVNGKSGTAVTTSGTITLTNVCPPICTSSTDAAYPLVFTTNVTAGCKLLYTDTANSLSYNPSTNLLISDRIKAAVCLYVGNPTSCTSSVAGTAGSIFNCGSMELYTATPYIDMHRNYACQDYSTRLITDSSNFCIIVNNSTGCTASTSSATYKFTPAGCFQAASVRATSSMATPGLYGVFCADVAASTVYPVTIYARCTDANKTVTQNCFIFCHNGYMYGNVCGTASSATNATCFGGCTYAQACSNIRSGLTGCTGTVTVSNSNANCNWPIALKTGATAIGCSTCCALTYNPTTGVLTAKTFCGAFSGTITNAACACCVYNIPTAASTSTNAYLYAGCCNASALSPKSAWLCGANGSFYQYFSTNKTNANYRIPFTSINGTAAACATQYIDCSSFTYNPDKNLLTVNCISLGGCGFITDNATGIRLYGNNSTTCACVEIANGNLYVCDGDAYFCRGLSTGYDVYGYYEGNGKRTWYIFCDGSACFAGCDDSCFEIHSCEICLGCEPTQTVIRNNCSKNAVLAISCNGNTILGESTNQLYCTTCNLYATAIGYCAGGYGCCSVVDIGYYAQSHGNWSVAIGRASYADTNSVAIGDCARNSRQSGCQCYGAVTIGSNSYSADGGVAIGANACTCILNGIAIGRCASSGLVCGVAYSSHISMHSCVYGVHGTVDLVIPACSCNCEVWCALCYIFLNVINNSYCCNTWTSACTQRIPTGRVAMTGYFWTTGGDPAGCKKYSNGIHGTTSMDPRTLCIAVSDCSCSSNSIYTLLSSCHCTIRTADWSWSYGQSGGWSCGGVFTLRF